MGSLCKFMTKQPMLLGFPGGSDGKESTCNEGDMSQEDALEKGVAIHSGSLAWRISWADEPGELPPLGSQRDETQPRV